MRIVGGTVVADPIAGSVHEGATVEVDGERVSDIGSLSGSRGRAHDIDARGCWVLPGLVDAHTHLYSALALGMPTVGEPARDFPQLLERLWWRLDKALTLEDVRVSGLVGALTSLRHGVTTIFDHHSSPSCPEGSLDALADAVGTVGLRASLAYEVSERDGPGAFRAGIDENVRYLTRCREREGGRLHGLFGLHSLYTLSDQAVAACVEANRVLGGGFHLHVLEHEGERRRFEGGHPGRGVVDWLAEHGIIGDDTIAAHCVHVNTDDIGRLGRSHPLCVHNPQSNMGNGVGVAPLDELVESGASVGLGTDGFYDVPQQMATVPLLQNLAKRDPSAFSAQAVVEMVYGANCRFASRAFGVPIGRILPGQAADLLVIEYEPATPVTPANLAAHLVRCLCQGRLRAVTVAGRVLIRDRAICGLDEKQVYAQSRRCAQALWERASGFGGSPS